MASKSMILMLKGKVQKIDDLLTEVADKDDELSRNRIEIAQLRDIISHHDSSTLTLELQNKIRNHETVSGDQLKEIHQLKNQITELNSKNEELLALRSQVTTLKAQNEMQSNELSSIKSEKYETTSLKKEITNLREELKRKDEQGHAKIQNNLAEMRKLEVKYTSMKNEIEKKNKKIIELQSEVDTTSLHMTRDKSSLLNTDFIQKIGKNLVALKSKICLIMEENSKLGKQGQQEEKLSQVLNRLTSELSSINDRASKINQMMSSLIESNEQRETEVLELNRKNEELDLKLEHEMSLVRELHSQIFSLRNQLNMSSLKDPRKRDLVSVTVQTDLIPPRVLSPSTKCKTSISDQEQAIPNEPLSPNVKVSFLPGAFHPKRVMPVTKKSSITSDDLPIPFHRNDTFNNSPKSENNSSKINMHNVEKKNDERILSLKKRVSSIKVPEKTSSPSIPSPSCSVSCSSSSEGEPSPKKCKTSSSLIPLGKSPFKRAEISVKRSKLSEMDRKKLVGKTIKSTTHPPVIRAIRPFGRLPPSLIGGSNQPTPQPLEEKKKPLKKLDITLDSIVEKSMESEESIASQDDLDVSGTSCETASSINEESEEDEEDNPLTIDLGCEEGGSAHINSETKALLSSCHLEKTELPPLENPAIKKKPEAIPSVADTSDKIDKTQLEDSTKISPPLNSTEPISTASQPNNDDNESRSVNNIGHSSPYSKSYDTTVEIIGDSTPFLQRMSLVYERERISKAELLQKREIALNLSNHRESIIRLIEEQLNRLWKSIDKETFDDVIDKISKEGFIVSNPRILIDILYVAVKAEKSGSFSEAPQTDMFCPPVLTVKQKKVIAFVHALDERPEFSGLIGKEFIHYLYFSLIGKGRMTQVLKLFEVLNLVRTYISLSRIKGEEERVKTFLFDVIFFNNPRMHAVVYNIILAWPDLFTWVGDGGGENADPILEATIWIIYNTGPATGASDFKVHDCRKCLQSRCGLISPYSSGIELVKKLIQRVTLDTRNDILKRSTIRAFLIISKAKDHKWTTNNLINPLLLLLSEENSRNLNEGEGLMPWIVESIGEVSRSYPVDERSHLEDVFNPIKSLLVNPNINQPLEAACIKSLIRLGHHLQHQCVKFLASWLPKFPVNEETEVLVQNYLGTRAHEFTHRQMKSVRPALVSAKHRRQKK